MSLDFQRSDNHSIKPIGTDCNSSHFFSTLFLNQSDARFKWSAHVLLLPLDMAFAPSLCFRANSSRLLTLWPFPKCQKCQLSLEREEAQNSQRTSRNKYWCWKRRKRNQQPKWKVHFARRDGRIQWRVHRCLEEETEVEFVSSEDGVRVFCVSNVLL